MSQSAPRGFRLFLLLAAVASISFSLVGCDSSGSSSSEPDFPTSPEDIQEAVNDAQQVTSEGRDIVTDEISEATSGDGFVFFDITGVLDEIESLDRVQSADPNEQNTLISAELQSGITVNIPIVQQDRDALFEKANSSSTSSPNTESSTVPTQIHASSTESGTAVYLAPHQSEFNRDIESVVSQLESAGFTVDVFTNEEAGLDRFRGEFLAQYDVVYFDTHGNIGKTIDPNSDSDQTLLATGNEFTSANLSGLSEDVKKSVSVSGGGRIAATPEFFRLTMGDESFSDTWVYAQACLSDRIESGGGSLSQTMLDLGAGGYGGYDVVFNSRFAEILGETLTSNLAAGRSLEEATQNTKSALDVQALEWILAFGSLDESGTGMIDAEELETRSRLSEPYYIVDPSQTVGIANASPSTGPPGTDVVYEVTIQGEFFSEVDQVDLFIDNTEEQISLSQESETVWREDQLSAPTAEEYPRTDTFTFTAYDAQGNALGSGSDTFTITSPNNNQPQKSSMYSPE